MENKNMIYINKEKVKIISDNNICEKNNVKVNRWSGYL